MQRRTIAYLAGAFPSRSETFVYREVRALRARGYRVCTASLHAPSADLPPDLQDVREGVVVVYERRELARALRELLAHPLLGASTLALAAGDALAPGEPTGLQERAKLIVQALAALGLARRLRQEEVEHLHCHFAHAPASVAMYAALHLGIPFSFTGHANDLFQRRALLKKKLQRASFVSCISRWHRELYRRVLPELDSKYVVVRCGVDVETWTAQPLPSAAERLNVLTVCRLVNKKGIDTLIRAVAALSRPVSLTIAGDGPEREALERLVREERCADRVQFLGAVDNDTVRRHMQEHAHVFALPCRTDPNGDRDGIPVVLIEAMACGRAVISGDLPAIRELIEDGQDGLLVPPDDPVRLAERLEGLTDARLQMLGNAGRRKVEAEFSLATAIGALEAALGRAER